ncbi:Isoniazid-induced protein IniA [Luteitalea pratensis]|uniref:Isoniazid-induced protein IniA n=1 Tax=Luteitalea pratensis TaxID=1855912 RepID=A0A143PFS9_LUTPR|nr:dynamin family protein [Luteitalea pratensis]AMY07113.1 Isoniazid-induced protein IniA [Luteitalea pratensis]
MVSALLRPEDQQLVNDERRALEALRDVLVRLDAAPDNLDALRQSIHQLDELFLVVIVGEFNAGKSAFINALLGAPVLEEGVTPTTAQVHLLQHGDTTTRVERSDHLHVITAPVEFLREIAIVDTPGTNAVIREHEAITADFVPRSDLVLFVTSADRPFTESERQFLAVIRDWGKKVVIVINKVDLLETAADLQKVLDFVAEHAQVALGSAPDTFPVSAKLAMRAKRGQPDLWAASRFEALERYIHDRLDQRERLRLKLANPIGIGTALASRYLEVTNGRLGLLQDDLRLLDDVEKQHAVYRTDMDRQFELRMGEIDNVLLQMEQRGHVYFDDMLRIGRVMDLLNKARVQEGFVRDVVADAPVQIERKVSELIDWMVSADLRQWQQVHGHLADRRLQYRDRIVGDPELATFHLERGRLLDSVGREAQRVVESFDRQREAATLAEGARNAVAASAAVGAGAVGLGTLVTIAASTAAADVTGILLAGVIATVGLFIVPARRRKAKEDLRQKVADLRETLSGALRTQFQQEAHRSTERLNEGVAPYSRFVRAEQQALTSVRDALGDVQATMTSLRARIDAVT